MAELLYGELTPGERAGLERHLLECPSCRADFELARAGARAEWPEAPVPAAVIESTLASLREPPPAVRFFRWATAAAALFGVAVLLVSSGRSRPPATPPQTPVAAAACSADRPTVLATMQEPVLGAISCQDESGRPVGDLSLQVHDVSVEILDGIAKTTVEETFENHTDRRLEGTFVFPLPSDASISRLALEVNGKMEEGTCLERERARAVFESIVRKMQDPALLEWQPGGYFKCRIFPIEPRATKRVIVAYTQTLPCFRGKMRYAYPLASEKTREHPPGEVRINVLARFSGELAAMESTSHHLDVRRKDAHEASMSFRATNYRPRNDFVVMLEPREAEVRVVCHKPEGEDGYFACFATPQAEAAREPRKYTFVLDASASTSAPRLEVAKRLVRAMMERRIDGDRFELIAHSIETRSSGEVDLRAANDFMDGLRPIGGSDVLKALQAAGPGEIVYIGKGLPTFGETDTAKILEAAKGLRIRTIAVGSDANLPLLERLGGMMRITPNDDVDKRVREIADTLGSSVISGIRVEGENIADVGGTRDVFAGERMVAVGRYKAAGPSTVVVSGRGYRREIQVAFPAKEEANNPVRRLWAQRKVADLLAQGESTKAEVTALGVKYQIMTPYTSFLVLESEQMWKDFQLQREKQKQDEVLGKQLEAEKKRTAQALDQDLRRFDTKVYQPKNVVPPVLHQAKVEPTRTLNGQPLNYPEADEALKNWPLRKTLEAELTRDAAGKPLGTLAYDPQTNAFIVRDRPEVQERIGRILEAADGTKAGAAPEWDELVNKLRANYTVAEQQKASQADEHYRLAERFYTAGDFEKAEIESQKAIQLSSDHAPARALNTEIQFMLGKGKATPSSGEYDRFMKQGLVGQPNLQEEIDRTLVAGERLKAAGDLAGAERELRKVRELSKWMPSAPGWESRAQKAQFPGDGRATTPGIPELNEIPLQGFLFKGEQPAFFEPEAVKPNGPVVEYDRPTWRTLRPSPVVDPETKLARLEPLPEPTVAPPPPPVVEPPAVPAKVPRGIMALPEEPDTENAPKAARMSDFQRQLDSVNTTATSQSADMQVYVRQLEVQLAQIQELTTKVDEHRAKLVKSLNEKSLASAELQYSRQLAERLQKDLEQLEEKHVEMAREKKQLEEKLSAIQSGGNVNVAPKKALEGRVTAVAPGIGLIVLSLGKDDGVLEGDEFTIYRAGEFVAKIVIDRADRKWSAGKIVLKKADPKVGDEVSNHVLVSCAAPERPLSEQERLDLESKASLQSIRLKMRMKE
jgi:Ca-activated chloride channel family protein